MISRRNPRLPDYDYRRPGVYFVTICTLGKVCSLGRAVGGDAHIAPHIALTALGRCCETYLRSMPGMREFVVMPNHVHFLLELSHGPMWASAPTRSLPDEVRSFKTLVTKAHGAPVWQRSYYDHIVSDENDFLRIDGYIRGNPARWAGDRFFER